MEIHKNGQRDASAGPSAYFTGAVQIEPVIDAPDPARIRAVHVTFQPRARTAWHTHPLGQTLWVTAGVGLVQSWGGTVREILPGDTVWIPPGEKHWHGAAPDATMSHLAFHEMQNGSAVDWLEHVTDDQYPA